MYEQDKERLVANVNWFNQFFGDLKQLLQAIAKRLSNEFSLSSGSFYYPKSDYTPSIPSFYAIRQKGGSFAVQVYCILNPNLLEDQSAFIPEPSLVIVKHSRGDRALSLSDYGMRVIRNDLVELTGRGKMISGTILGGEGKGTRFHAFQVPLDPFIGNQNVDEVIRKEIIDMLRQMPDW
jgi:hypothetical protein